MQSHDQVTGPPAHHAMDSRDRPFVHDPRQKRPVLLVELGWRTWRGDIDQTIRPLLVKPDHPVAKRLPVHPANLGSLRPRCAIEHRSDRQKASDLIAVLRPPREPAHVNRCKIPSNRNRLAHGNSPVAMLNHRSSDLGIPGESQHLSGLVLPLSFAAWSVAPHGADEIRLTTRRIHTMTLPI